MVHVQQSYRKNYLQTSIRKLQSSSASNFFCKIHLAVVKVKSLQQLGG